MSERSVQLAVKAGRQLEDIIAFVQSLRPEDLEKPDPDRPGRTLADAAAHMAEGYHHLGRFLEAQVFAPGSPKAGHVHGRPPDLRLSAIVNRAVEARAAVARVADIADERLDDVPPPRTSRFSDGRRTVEQIIEAVVGHQAEHLASLQSAVRGPTAAPAGSQE